MEQRINTNIAKECYQPVEVLTNILDDALLLEKEAEMIQKEIVAGGITESMIRKQKEWKLKKRNLDKRKVNVLDNAIFPSMANLTVLLEATASSALIEHMFEDDLKSLFFSKSKAVSVKSKVPEDRYKASRSIFTRFINACAALTIHKPEGKGYVSLDESRLVLCDIMQEAVYRALLDIAPRKYEDVDFLQKTLYADMDRMHAWTTMLAGDASKELVFDEDRRPALF